MFYTALGNPFWELSFDNARPANDLGVDVNGNGSTYWIAQKYAIGRGPKRWIYRRREPLGILCSADGTRLGLYGRGRFYSIHR